MKRSFLLLLLLYLLPFSFLIILVAWLFSSGYEEFITFLAKSIQKPEWEKFIRMRFTLSAFKVARIITLLLLFLYSAFGMYLFRKRKVVTNSLISFFTYIRSILIKKFEEFRAMPLYARRLLIILLVFSTAKALWYIITIPLQYDEAWSYNYYIGNNFWESFVLPHNNHPFFTLVSWFFRWLPLDPGVSMRLPNLFAGLLLILLFFFLIKKYFSINAALFAAYWLATCCPVVFYMLYARGYLFIILFTLVALWSQFIVLQNEKNRSSLFILFVSIVLGYWSNPVFLYAHTAIAICTFTVCVQRRKWAALRKIILLHSAGAVLVIILYLPTLLSSHIHELLHAGVRSDQDINVNWLVLYYNSYFQLGFREGYILFSLLILLFILVIVNKKSLNFFSFFVISSFFVILLFSNLQSLPLSAHITIFLAVTTGVLLAILFYALEKKISLSKPLFALVLAVVMIMNSYFAHTHHWLNWSLRQDESVKKVASVLMKARIKTCYLTAYYYKPYLEYYYKIHGERIHIGMPDSVSHDFRSFNTAEEETIVIKNNIGVLGINFENYHEIFRDEIVTVYKRKDIP